jgi:acylphosphatase
MPETEIPAGRKERHMNSSEKVRKHIVFYGWVQGVGFRWRARHAANMYDCTGWVRNNPNGSVTMEIQGKEENIDQVITSIERGNYVRIENMSCKTIPLVENDIGFIAR